MTTDSSDKSHKLQTQAIKPTGEESPKAVLSDTLDSVANGALSCVYHPPCRIYKNVSRTPPKVRDAQEKAALGLGGA